MSIVCFVYRLHRVWVRISSLSLSLKFFCRSSSPLPSGMGHPPGRWGLLAHHRCWLLLGCTGSTRGTVQLRVKVVSVVHANLSGGRARDTRSWNDRWIASHRPPRPSVGPARRAARPSSPLLGPPLAAKGIPCHSRSFKRSPSGGWPRQTAGVSVTCAARFGPGRRGGGRRPSRERGAGRASPELLAPNLPLPLPASPAAPPAASARGSSEMAAGGAPRFSWRGRPAGLGEGRPR